MAQTTRRWPRPWSVLGVAAALLAGLLFATSARTARGTDLRSGRRLQLTELIARERSRAAALDSQARDLRREVLDVTRNAAARDERVQTARRSAAQLEGAAGLTAVQGPGIEVTLDDAPRLRSGEQRPGNPSPDDLVVHEQDVLAVLNALWAGGAEAVTVMGERIVSTSHVRCVGNTLLVDDAVYSPPFILRGIGDATRLRAALDAAPGVALFRTYVDAFDLGYSVAERSNITMPAYDGQLRLTSAVDR